ncbi:btb domain and ankyrin repeat protein [Moniliophthora roreri MCA 2997]|uniref:Btb domain and ankyrin repeat protein n=1 Tax=Moniliophthora roreri (strain MCA 2997) TaxID=1381753 RepID=V2XHN2_MONRO|nr:btb domain and ankyrin repeat protein [Moniliophthora roreri MCA 2997]
MSLLHVHFHLRNLQAFRRLLSGIASDDQSSTASTSPSRSLKSRSSVLNPDREPLDINAKDSLGRTILHIASASIEASSVEYVRLLLKCQGINVNALDGESQWTALHRAMYVGNLGVVLLLLQHPTTDPTIKDLEGFTAFDLYNSTVEGTKPNPNILTSKGEGGGELFTWGVNRNALLAHGDSSDRSFPDQVIPPKVDLSRAGIRVEDRFARPRVRQIKMGKLHTADSSSSVNTLGLCGFGSGGRLGHTQHTQYTLKPIFISATSSFPPPSTPSQGKARVSSGTIPKDRIKFAAMVPASSSGSGSGRIKIISVALGQDHTLALTENGEVFSWGLNRFAQLGYVVESGGDNDLDSGPAATATTGTGEQIQLSPRRVYGALKKEWAIGVAACKGASACWVKWDGTGESNVYTWGLNGGQLGYDRVGTGVQVQVLPRKVTKITKPIVQIALMESAMACLLASGGGSGASSGDVLIVWGDRVARINFPTHTFPSPIMPYRPPQALRSTRITKIVCSDDTPQPFSVSSLAGSTPQSGHAPSSSHPSSGSALSSMIQSSENVSAPTTVNFACVSEGGEVFVFGAPGVPPIGIFGSGSGNTSDMLDADTNTSGGNSGNSLALGKLFKPQRVWALKRGLIGAVKDAAIGSDGTLVVCTVSGHVYVRSRSAAASNPSTVSITSGFNNISVSPSDSSAITKAGKSGGSGGSGGGGKSNKFSRVPFLQRVVSVCASSTGAFGAIRIDAEVPEILSSDAHAQTRKDGQKGWNLAEDMKVMRPWMWRTIVTSPLDKEWLVDRDAGSFLSTTGANAVSSPGDEEVGNSVESLTPSRRDSKEKRDEDAEEDTEDDKGVDKDAETLVEMCSLLVRLIREINDNREISTQWGDTLPLGADLLVSVPLTGLRRAKGKGKAKALRGPIILPAHRMILGGRSNILASLLSSGPSIAEGEFILRALPSVSSRLRTERGSLSVQTLEFSHFHPLTVLVLLEYLYTDELVCVWDRRISFAGFTPNIPKGTKAEETKALRTIVQELNLAPALENQIKSELQILGRMLDLPEMLRGMESVVKRPLTPTLKKDMANAYQTAQNPCPAAVKPDVVLLLAESKEVQIHSTVLRARSELFEAFLGEEMWTKNRWNADSQLRVDLKHMRWGVVEYVLRWMCCGEDEDLFGSLDFVSSVDEALEFLFEVISVANELLLSPLILLTSRMILKFLHTSNACYILTEASHYNVQPLVASVQGYIAADLETFLEGRMLEALAPALVKQLSAFVRQKQEEKAGYVRGSVFANELMDKWNDWLKQEDIPAVIIPSATSQRRLRERRASHGVKLSPPSPSFVASHPSGKQKGSGTLSANDSPVVKASLPSQTPAGGDDLFDMDGLDIGPPSVPTASVTQAQAGSVPVWKASSVPRVDMRALLAQEASALDSQRASSSGNRATSSQDSGSPFKTLKHHSSKTLSSVFESAAGTSPNPTPVRLGGSPWKTQSTPTRTTPAAPIVGGSPTRKPSSTGNASRQGQAPRPNTPPRPSQSNQSGLGPVITPIKMATPKSSSPSIPRRTSSSNAKAWVSAPTHQPLPPSLTAGMSFMAIQQLELEQGVASGKDKRSLTDIQKEEQDRRQEEDFLKWWEAEEERVRQETEALRLAEERSKKDGGRGGDGGQKKHRKPKGKASGVSSGSKPAQSGGAPQTRGGGGSRNGPRGKKSTDTGTVPP